MSQERPIRRSPVLAGGRTDRRLAFTLIELLVVIGIIAFLLTITFIGFTNSISLSKSAATKATLRKVDSALKDRLAELDKRWLQKISGDDQKKQAIVSSLLSRWGGYNNLRSSVVPSMPAIPSLKLPQTVSFFTDSVVRMILILNEFPQSFDPFELNINTASVSGTTFQFGYDKHPLTRRIPQVSGPPAPASKFPTDQWYGSTHQRRTESAELLYYMLVEIAPARNVEDGGLFAPREIADTDGDGLMEIVDGWGEPLRFYRWPTRIVRPFGPFDSTETRSSLPPGSGLAGNWRAAAVAIFGRALTEPPSLSNNDQTGVFSEMQQSSIDTGGLVNQAVGSAIADQKKFEQSFCTLSTFGQFLVVSTGPDKQLGLLEPYDRGVQGSPNFGYLGQWQLGTPDDDARLAALLDNLTNYNIR